MFLADLLDVDRMGFWVAMGPDPGSHLLGFDNFDLRIPEPDTVILLSAVLLTMGLFHRKGIMDFISKMRSLWMKA